LAFLNRHYLGEQTNEHEIGSAGGTNWDRTGAYRVSMGKTEGQISFGRPRYGRLEDNIKIT
jgi:hypothetical protein